MSRWLITDTKEMKKMFKIMAIVLMAVILPAIALAQTDPTVAINDIYGKNGGQGDGRVTVLGILNAYGTSDQPKWMEATIRAQDNSWTKTVYNPVNKDGKIIKGTVYQLPTVTVPKTGNYVVNVGVGGCFGWKTVYGQSQTINVKVNTQLQPANPSYDMPVPTRYNIPPNGGALKRRDGTIDKVYIPVSAMKQLKDNIKAKAGSFNYNLPTIDGLDGDALTSLGVSFAGAATLCGFPEVGGIGLIVIEAGVLYNNGGAPMASSIIDWSVNKKIYNTNNRIVNDINKYTSNSNGYIIINIDNKSLFESTVQYTNQNYVEETNGGSYTMVSMDKLSLSDRQKIDNVFARVGTTTPSTTSTSIIIKKETINADRWANKTTTVYNTWEPNTRTKYPRTIPTGTRVKAKDKLTLSNGDVLVYVDTYNGEQGGVIFANDLNKDAPVSNKK